MSIDFGGLAAHVASGLGALKGYGHADTAAAKSLQYALDELMKAYEAAKASEQPPVKVLSTHCVCGRTISVSGNIITDQPDELTEEVARAICNSHGMMTPFDMREGDAREIAMNMARAAINAMGHAGSVGAKASCVSDPQISTSSACPASAKEWPDPTPEMLKTPEFNAVWECIKRWDISVPYAYTGYCGATGNHVRAILDALSAMGDVPSGSSKAPASKGAIPDTSPASPSKISSLIGCPFCRNRALKLITDEWKRYVWCTECGGRGPCVNPQATEKMIPREMAIDRWNTRTNEPVSVSLEKCAEALADLPNLQGENYRTDAYFPTK